MDNKIIVTEKAKKTIQINPEFLKLNGNIKKNTTLKRKQKPIQTQKVETNPSIVKKKLIEKIQAFKNKAVIEKQEQKKQEKGQEEEREREKFNNEFNKSLDFLQSLSNKRKEIKAQQQTKVQQNKVQQNLKNKTLKHGKIERIVHNEVINEILETELPPELSSTFRYPPQKNINFLIDETISEPISSEPISSEPIASESIASEPIASEPISSEPISSEPISSEPMQSQSMQSQSMQSQSMQSQSMQSQSMQSQSMQSQSMQSQSMQSRSMQPAYSNLKNGSKPTFREWKNQTLKNQHVPRYKKLQIEEEHFEESDALQECIQKPIEDKPILKDKPIEQTILSIENPLKTQSIKKITTRTLKYKLGKRGKKVGVLIKNAKTRKIIQKEYALLKQKQISDIKNYLRSKNLLKIGSDAPNDVLRQMYEQAILSGEVENKAGETLIHNFMHA